MALIWRKILVFVCFFASLDGFLPIAHSTVSIKQSREVFNTIHRTYTSPEEAAKNIGHLADLLESYRDPRSLFPHIYSTTITGTLAKIKQGQFRNPKWVRSLVLNYANIYRRTILTELKGKRRQLPISWQLDFNYNERVRPWGPDLDVIYSIHVHIARDLVEALLVTPTNYLSKSEAQDFNLISEALKEAMPQIWRIYLRYGAGLPLPPSLQQSIMNQWIAQLRHKAWLNAKSAASLSIASQKDFLARIDRYLFERAQYFGLTLPLRK